MEILSLITGIAVGLVIGYLLTRLIYRRPNSDSELHAEVSILRSKLEQTQEQERRSNELAAENEKRYLAQAKENEERYLSQAREREERLNSELEQLKKEVRKGLEEFTELNRKAAGMEAENRSLKEKLDTQKQEIEQMGKKFSTEFENIANRILDDKTLKFTKQNRDNLDTLLKPLGENIEKFRKRVDEVYEAEAKERFSLGKELQRLVELNQKVSAEANALTHALKGDSKIQGDWGQMILENILEQSGLEKDREYFTQHFLRDEDGNPLKNEEGKKLQPDVVINYPDDRKVIIDSKVSLTAYTRYAESDDPQSQKVALKAHLDSMRTHIDQLSAKSYQDFAASLDFVMMFVPNEPAYLLALKSDPDLWHYAYNKRILFISPTNLIAALKMIADLWKREYQNQNAQAIAERGSALYDKFVGFVDNLQNVGGQLDRAQSSYSEAMKQLKDGHGNLIGQAEKLRELGVKAKKELPKNL